MVSVDGPPAGSVVVVGLTHVGLVRRRNEDAVLVGAWTSQSSDSGVERVVLPPSGGLVAVADGLGGHPDGHLASAAALRALIPWEGGADPADLAALVTSADDAVRAEAWQSGAVGMATTLVLVSFQPGAAVTANVGDSRCYVTDDDSLRQLSTDDTEVVTAFGGSRGARTVLTQTLGRPARAGGGAAGHHVVTPTRPGQRFLLCSDGLWDVVPADVLEGEVTSTSPLEDVAARLLGVALTLGASDNVTLVLAEVLG